MNNLRKSNKNWVIRLAVLGVTATLITGGLVAGTMAKYVAKVGGSDMARVAKFVYDATTVNAKGESVKLGSEKKDINLFAYKDDSGMTSKTGVIGEDQVVAPGTSGMVNIDISNSSEVAISSILALTESNEKKIPIVYKYGNTYYSSILKGFAVDPGDALKLKLHADDVNMVELHPGNTFQELALELAKPKTLSPITSENSKISAAQVKLEWFWPYEMYVGTSGDDTGDLLREGLLGDTWDSDLGVADTKAEVSIGIQAEFQQLDEIE